STALDPMNRNSRESPEEYEERILDEVLESGRLGWEILRPAGPAALPDAEPNVTRVDADGLLDHWRELLRKRADGPIRRRRTSKAKVPAIPRRVGAWARAHDCSHEVAHEALLDFALAHVEHHLAVPGWGARQILENLQDLASRVHQVRAEVATQV